jgi:hypothetical protein
VDWSLLQEKGKNLLARMGGTQSVLGQMILHKEPENKIVETIKLIQ